MTGDILNKALMERLEITDIKTRKKFYHIHGTQRMRGSTLTVVLYNRVGKTKTKVMELTDFIKNFDLKD